MNTIINTPPNQRSEDGMGLGLILGVILTVFAVLVFFVYVLPILQAKPNEEQTPTTQNIEIKLPAVSTTPEPAE